MRNFLLAFGLIMIMGGAGPVKFGTEIERKHTHVSDMKYCLEVNS